MVKKHLIAPFLNKAKGTDGLVNKQNPEWMRICDTVAFTLNMNPQTEDRDYICDENATTELVGYKPAFNTPLVMNEKNPNYRYVFDKFYDEDTGDKAKSELLLVFFQEALDSGETPTHFKAWRVDTTIVINDLNSVDKTITFDTNFNGKIKKGYVTVTEGVPAFTEGTYSAS